MQTTTNSTNSYVAGVEKQKPTATSQLAERSSALLDPKCIQRGYVILARFEIRQLRQARLMSQQDLANECWRRSIQISLTTIKRAEAGRPVRFRIAREFAKCFEVPLTRIVCDILPTLT